MSGLTKAHGSSRVPAWAWWISVCITCTGCELVKGIFKAGVWTGVLGVFAVVALVFWGLMKLVRR